MSNQTLTLIGAFLFGALIGSFLNVVIHRAPRRESLVYPGSRCSECASPVRFYDNIPIVSWFALCGLCRACGAPFSVRYPFIEALTATLTCALALRFGFGYELFSYAILIYALIGSTFIDLDHQIIPDEISIGALMIGLILSWWSPVGLSGALTGALIGGGAFFLIASLYPGGMGGGDIKLMAAIGAYLGWELTILTIILASGIGSIFGLGAMAFFGAGRKTKTPFGPFLAIGATLSVFFGAEIIEWYLVSWVLF